MKLFGIFLLLAVSFLESVSAEKVSLALRAQRIATGLHRPVYVTHAPGQPDLLYIVEARDSKKIGRIKILNLKTGRINPTPFLQVPKVNSGNEEGLLCMAFHPQYAKNKKFYTYHCGKNKAFNPKRPHRYIEVSEYTSSPQNLFKANPQTKRTLLITPQPYGNHNGGWLGFDHKGVLLIATGDGGSANDPYQTGQALLDNPETAEVNEALLGKILRIIPHGDDFPADPQQNYQIPHNNPFKKASRAHPAIWAYGLRNPWRCSIDRKTGDLWIGDVGQNHWEEINFEPASAKGGLNYGWRALEGNHQNRKTKGDSQPESSIPPIHEYSHKEGISVTGGYVYRGKDIPILHGAYLFCDYAFAKIWTIQRKRNQKAVVVDHTLPIQYSLPEGQRIGNISSFGEDARGELYLCDLSGGIFKLLPPKK